MGPGKKTTALQQHEINEAGYLAGRAALADPIDAAEDLRRLVDGNETVQETRTRLDRGRGNVVPDIQASNAASTYRTRTSYAVKTRSDLGGANENERECAAALALGAGSCDQNGLIAARLHGPKLGDGETANVVHDRALRHTWAEIRTSEKPNVVMDPWANGPAMQLGDTAWATQRRHPKEVFDAQGGTAARDSLLRLAGKFMHGKEAKVLTGLLREHQRAPSAGQRAPYSGSNQLAASPYPNSDTPGFGEKARLQMQANGPVYRQVLAVGAARGAYGMNVAAATAQADPILKAAQSLDTMPDALARPPLHKPSAKTWRPTSIRRHP